MTSKIQSGFLKKTNKIYQPLASLKPETETYNMRMRKKSHSYRHQKD